jgi:effector-binding domain-containing protein
MRFLKGLLIFIAALVALLVVVAFFLPKTSHVERSITIDRPPSEVFGVINNIHRFNAWSPWFDLDPNAKYTYSGPSTGVGAKLAWVGNKDVGSGSQEFVASKPNELLKVQLDFGDMGRPVAELRLAPAGSGTKVTWTLDQSFEGSLIGRYFGLMMDSMVGKDYDKGLAKLKTLVETFPAADISGINGENVDLAAQKIYYVSVGPLALNDMAAIGAAIRGAYVKIGEFLKANNLTMQGAPMTITTSYDGSGWKFDAAVSVAANEVVPSGDVKAGTTYAGKAVQFTHVGPYEKLGDTVIKAYAWLAVQGLKPKDRLIEEYVSDPGNTPADQLKTLIKIPVES